MGVEGIPESSPIDDGLHGGQQGWSRPGDQRGETAPRQLLGGRDRVELTPPVAGALGVVHASLLGAVRDRLGVDPPPLLRAEYATDPSERAEQLVAEVAALLNAAQRAGVPRAVERLQQGAEQGAEQALEVLRRLGHLDGEAGEAVAALLRAWGERLARLVGR